MNSRIIYKYFGSSLRWAFFVLEKYNSQKYLTSRIFCLTGQVVGAKLSTVGYCCKLRGIKMISYNKLWHVMLDKNLKRTDLCEKAGISSSTLAKLGKNEIVALDVLERICDYLNCDIGDILSFREEINNE